MRSSPHPRTVRRRGRHGLPALLLAAGVALTGCTDYRLEPPTEVLPQLEFPYDEAFAKARHEVPDSRPFSLGLRDSDAPAPVWYGRVVTPDGTVHEVRMDAVRGRVLGTSVPAGQSASAKARTAALTERARLLPSEAVGRVKEPYFGKVTQIELSEGRRKAVVWRITVAAIRQDDLRTYQVDAVTGEVLSVREGGPAARATVAPPSTALPTPPTVSPPEPPSGPPSTPAPYRPSP
ncbi:PepSY domain-containing protein [Streptomyces griseoaurantiacus]|uniref:PepSY domain-containing protein n=1 Tax=Streptomyces griseoaurantiacus TaxID=68213 RepID=UPI003245251D